MATPKIPKSMRKNQPEAEPEPPSVRIVILEHENHAMAQFRASVAMAVQMLLEIAEEHGAIPAESLSGLVGQLTDEDGDDAGQAFLATLVGRLERLKIVPRGA